MERNKYILFKGLQRYAIFLKIQKAKKECGRQASALLFCLNTIVKLSI